MHVDVTRPGQTETEGLKVPVVYELESRTTTASPRDERGSTSGTCGRNSVRGAALPPVQPTGVSQRAAAVGRSSQAFVDRHLGSPRVRSGAFRASPGTGLSLGCPTVGGVRTSRSRRRPSSTGSAAARRATPTRDGNEEVTADWSTGKVGMTGTSYNGTLPIAAATTGVEGLEAIIPVAPNTSYYHYYRSNGLVRHPGGWHRRGHRLPLRLHQQRCNPERRPEWCNRMIRDERDARVPGSCDRRLQRLLGHPRPASGPV